MVEQGSFIVLDGTDGSGKATQTKMLVDRLRAEDCKVEMADFPQYGKKSAALIEDYLNGKFGSPMEVGPYRASVFYACDRFEASERIRAWLNSGINVVSNRYTSANMGHQAGKIKNLNDRNKFLEWLDNFEFEIFKIPRPDLNILLFMPPEVGQELVDKKGERAYVGGQKRDIHEADANHLKDAAEAYQYCAQKYGWKIVNCAPGKNLRSIEDIHEEIYAIAKQKIDEAIQAQNS